jgi:hypothetical protein
MYDNDTCGPINTTGIYHLKIDSLEAIRHSLSVSNKHVAINLQMYFLIYSSTVLYILN